MRGAVGQARSLQSNRGERQSGLLLAPLTRDRGLRPKFTQKENTMPHTALAERGSKQATDTAIRPFQVDVPEADLTELRRRINATKWPERETVTDATQGVQLATVQALARYLATEDDWRKDEAK